MKFFKKTAISLMIAASLTACSDKKENETKETTTTEVTAPQPKKAEKFAEMLAYVPADTSYLIANSKPIPDEVLASQMKRLQAILGAVSANIKSAAKSATDAATSTASADDKGSATTEATATDDAAAKTEAATTAETSTAEEPNVGDFLEALLKEFDGNLTKEGLTKLGIKADGHGMVYSLDMLPVIRYELANKDDFKALLSRAEKNSGYKVEWSKCGDYDCVESKDDGELNIAAVFLADQVVIAPFSADKKQQMMDHLIGKQKPEKSYSTDDWQAFLTANKYQGYSEGFINLVAMVDKLEQFALTQEKKTKGDSFDEQAFKSCFAVAKAHVNNVPKLVFGTKEMTEKTVQYEVLAQTSTDISTVLQGLPNKLEGLQQPNNPIFSLGLNLNMPNVRGALSQYINFLAKSGEENKCAAIDPVSLRKAIGGLSMAMTMGAGQFKSVFVALDQIAFDDGGKPSKIEAFGTVVADDPMALLQMLAMVNPQFATLQVPDDGKPVKLPAGMLPPGPVAPELSLSRQGKSLNVLVGNDQMALAPLSVKESTVLWNVVDSKRYYGLINKAIEQSPQGSDADTKNAMEMMNALGDMSGVMSQQIGFDQRGIVIDYKMQY